MKHIANPEQRHIIDSVKQHQNVRINAYSGTGKTSTLVMIAEEVHKESLYICFNRSNADEARDRFPSHVKTYSSHSVAYRSVGHIYRHKLARPVGKYQNVGGTSSEVYKLLKVPPVFKEVKKQTASELVSSPKMKSGIKRRIDLCVGSAIRSTVARFEQSADNEIELKHVSLNTKTTPFTEWDISRTDFETPEHLVLHYAKELWDMRMEVDNNILIGHDTYLKIWQLSEPRLDDIYDVIYLDEAQDSNPCLLAVLYNQNCRLVFVGDQYQSIYTWRGAVNAMTNDGGKEWFNCMLSTSFRYGDKIAGVANSLLGLKPGSEESVKSAKNGDIVVNNYGYTSYVDNKIHTRIYRTNQSLLADAVALVTGGINCSIEIDLGDFIKILESALALNQNRMSDVKHDTVSPYSSWEEYEMDQDNKVIVTIVTQKQAQRVINVLRSHRNHPNPQVTLTTAHKSKGREWDVVWINNDFPDVVSADGIIKFVSDEERNLMYVAATRAKSELYYNKTIAKMI